MISRIITIDQSTSATKAMLFSEDCELLHRVNIEHQQFYPQIGWVEHDAEEIYKNTIEAIHCLLEQEEVKGYFLFSCHHQSARNGGCLEPTYRQVRLSCRGMAMPAGSGYLQRTER